MFPFYNNLFKSKKRRPTHQTAQFLSLIQIPHLTEEQSAIYEISILGDEVICTLKNMQNISPGNNGLTKEFYEKNNFGMS